MKHDLTRDDVLTHALAIHEDYKKQGLKLTLRQMYYQFVARGLAPSGQKVYKRIGDVLTEARYAATFPVDGLEDRGRTVQYGNFTRTCPAIETVEHDARGIQSALPSFLLKKDRWYGQDTFVSVWVEKEALSGVFETICDELGVSWFACKGYPSVSSLYDWLKRAYFACGGYHVMKAHRIERKRRFTFGNGFDWSEDHVGQADRAVVLYFGDHDPDGWEIPRSAERNLQALMDAYGLAIPLEFRRIGLTMDQIEQYAPPPFEAKITSARYASYVEEHETEDAWELDALDPSVLRDLVKEHTMELFNDDIAAANNDRVKVLRRDLRERLGLSVDVDDADLHNDLDEVPDEDE